MSQARWTARRRPLWPVAFALALAASLPVGTYAQQAMDAQYTARIIEYTTEPFFLTRFVDHLPASSTVPTPMQHFGDVAGAPRVLHKADEIHEYYRMLERASPRIRTFSIGTSEEGREILLAAISSERNMGALEELRAGNLRLADPRGVTAAEVDALVASGRAAYWLTGAMHSTETGSPETLIELAYRLVASEAPEIRMIRDSVVVFITPVIEVDGRARVVDRYRAQWAGGDGPIPPLLYWGHYVRHDNNRDNIGLSLELSRAVTRTFLAWQPQVVHDLHESASYLYTSTGRGPYNAWVDPITINEWMRLAYREVKVLTELGVPGVYTHDFYDGWAPNYMLWVANVRNSIGRFYEVQGAQATQVTSNTQRQWHRPNTPLPAVRWSTRNHVNLAQSGVIVALEEVARNKSEYLRTFHTKAARSVGKATAEGPAAYLFPAGDPRPGQQARLLALLQRQGVEVHRLTAAASAGGAAFPAGSYAVRLDQPSSRLVDMFLDRQYYSRNDPSPYDDTGWTLGPLFGAETVRVEDPAILAAAMTRVTDTVAAPGGLAAPAPATGTGAAAFLIHYSADNGLAAFRFARPELRIEAAQRAFQSGGRDFGAGSFIVRPEGNPADLASILDRAGRQYGFLVHPAREAPAVATHPVRAPRIALLHNWQNTQTEGWVRIGLDEYGVPYDYVGPQDIRDTPRLLDRWDVIVIGPGSSVQSLVEGVSGERPVPYQGSELLPSFGRITASADIRGGMEFRGVLSLMNFLNEGGTLVTLGSSSALPIHYGLSGNVAIQPRQNLWAPGGVFRTLVSDQTSPIVYGFGPELGVYFNNTPVFTGGGGVGGGGGGRGGGGGGAAVSAELARLGSTTAGYSRRGGLDDTDVPQGRPRVMGELMEGRAAAAATGSGPGAATQATQATGRGGGAPGRGGGAGGRGGGAAAQAAQAAADPVRFVLRYPDDPRELLISGGLDHGIEMAGSPALVHSRVGRGNVVMFSFNPFWRGTTLGSYALLFNTFLHHANLDAGGSGVVE